MFFVNDPAPTEIYTLSLHDALPIAIDHEEPRGVAGGCGRLRDRVGRQRVVERGQLHGPSVYMVDARPRLPLRARARHRGSADVTLTAPRAFPEGRAALKTKVDSPF